jgi:hypothetical protein
MACKLYNEMARPDYTKLLNIPNKTMPKSMLMLHYFFSIHVYQLRYVFPSRNVFAVNVTKHLLYLLSLKCASKLKVLFSHHQVIYRFKIENFIIDYVPEFVNNSYCKFSSIECFVKMKTWYWKNPKILTKDYLYMEIQCRKQFDGKEIEHVWENNNYFEQ